VNDVPAVYERVYVTSNPPFLIEQPPGYTGMDLSEPAEGPFHIRPLGKVEVTEIAFELALERKTYLDLDSHQPINEREIRLWSGMSR